MKWLLIGLAVIVGLVVVVAIVGSLLPRDHKASRTLRVRRAPAEVWPPVVVVESQPPYRLVTRVAETEKNFGGTWTIAIVAVPDPSTGSGQVASTLTITEDGWVANPIFRFMSRLVIGHHATMDALLKDVARKFNEEPALSGE
ncbi:MAG: hypothetical protein AUH72_11735 [Acidobacteria bacterium 13_1_40CM_4_65_8]|nr:MAG: hypothetical protein AUH72_11735 [Acidobacteria bacterium 13_1_40CM_4_65_8]